MYFENECTVVTFFIRGWSTYAKGLIVKKKYSINTVKNDGFYTYHQITQYSVKLTQ